jgi:predicted double-glycine peptidase
VIRRARHPLLLGTENTSVDERIGTAEADAVWLEPLHEWHEQHSPTAQSTSASLAVRDRAATTARPLQHARVEQMDGSADASVDASVDVEPDTLIVIPHTPQQLILPALSDKRFSSRQTLSVIRCGRILLFALMLYYALSSGVQLAGGSALPLAPFPWVATSGAASGAAALPPLRMDGKVATRVQPMTQMRRVDLYDSKTQFDRWAGSACSAASLAEILTAYGLPHMTIGRMIRELGPDISAQWGLLSYNAFNKVVAKYGLRADVYLENNPLTYKQMLYLTNTLGIPVTINMRATTGYYRFLSGGHILVMTGGDSKTIRLADSSLYYMKSLPLSVYNQMARSRNVVIVPKHYHYTLPR